MMTKNVFFFSEKKKHEKMSLMDGPRIYIVRF